MGYPPCSCPDTYCERHPPKEDTLYEKEDRDLVAMMAAQIYASRHHEFERAVDEAVTLLNTVDEKKWG